MEKETFEKTAAMEKKIKIDDDIQSSECNQDIYFPIRMVHDLVDRKKCSPKVSKYIHTV